MVEEHEDFSWIDDSLEMDSLLEPFVTSLPTTVSVVYLYTTPNYHIGKIRKEQIDLSSGVLSSKSLELSIKEAKQSETSKYRYVRTFVYKVNCEPKQVLEYGQGTLDNLDTQLIETSDLHDIRFPSCVAMFHDFNTVYIVLQKTTMSSHKKMTKRVRFDVSSRKTRRN
jgi:hypothetical protein